MHILIIDDDRPTDLDRMADAAGSLGHEVDATDSPDHFRDVVRSRSVDVQIVDYAMPTCDGPELVAVTAAETNHVPTVFLTNYKPDCENRVADFDPRLVATTIEKPASLSVNAWRERLSEAIDEITSLPAFSHPEPLGVPTDELSSGLFSTAPKEIDALDEDARDDLEAEASNELHPHLLSAWDACDDDWLMLQRVDDTVLITDRGNDAELPTIDAAHESELDRDSPALILGRPTVLEEAGGQGLVDCSPHSNHDWHRYPFVRLIVGNGERDFHLDTGSSTSYISREFLAENTELPRVRPKRHIVSDLAGREEPISQLPVDLNLHVSGPMGNVEVAVRVQAVKNWRRAKLLNPSCSGQLCPDSNDGQCGRRHGLIGRDMLYCHREGVWQFDPASGQFYAQS